jgi:hypothetical protein
VFATRGAMAVPPSFLGISSEYGEVKSLAQHRVLLSRVFAMLHVPGDGPMMWRIGGDSADLAALDLRRRLADPRWLRYELGAGFFHNLARVVQVLHPRLVLDLNTADRSPAGALALARTALRDLPPGTLRALEVGNEPDLFDYWHTRLAGLGRARIPPLMRAGTLTPRSYGTIFAAYARLLHRELPRLSIAGPALAEPNLNLAWQTTALRDAGSAVSIVTGHRYPLSDCATSRSDPQFPTISRVLSNAVTVGMAGSLRRAVGEAHRMGRPYVLTEMNSVTCGGRSGVSNTFATALWAPDALFSLIRAHVSAADLHVRIDAVNAPFTFTGRGLVARPLLYGLAVFARTLGPKAILLSDRARVPHGNNLRVWAVRSGTHLRVLLIDKSHRPITVRLHLPVGGVGELERLSAPSVRARRHVELDGQSIGSRATWVGPPQPQAVTVSSDGQAVVRLEGDSAALLTLNRAMGA